MADGAFASFERKWLDANPEQAAALVFLDATKRRRASAFGTLIHELSQTAFGVREAGVAAAKLEWWRQELAAASTGNARHPITRELFTDERAGSVDMNDWRALADGALAQLDAPPSATLDDAMTHLSGFYAPVAAVETHLDGTHDTEGVAALWILSHLVQSLAAGSASHEHSQVPLDLQARHRVSRADALSNATLQKDFMDEIHRRLADALAKASTAPLGRRVRARSDLAAIERARRAGHPSAAIAAQLHRFRLRHVVWSWREARHLARTGLEDAGRNPS